MPPVFGKDFHVTAVMSFYFQDNWLFVKCKGWHVMGTSYNGKMARINLSTGEIRVEPLDMEQAVKFIGGRGLVTKILYDEARLIEGLPVKNPTELSSLVCELLSKK